MGGADALNGAVSAAGAEKAKRAISDYLENNKGSLSGEAYQSLMEIGSAMVGGALGGSTGANIAVTGDRFNRQLHPDEERIIASLQSRGYSEEELRAVACVLVQCLLGRNLVDPQGLIASSSSIKLTEAGQALQGQYQSILDGMSEERKDQISSLLKGTGAFGYTPHRQGRMRSWTHVCPRAWVEWGRQSLECSSPLQAHLRAWHRLERVAPLLVRPWCKEGTTSPRA